MHFRKLFILPTLVLLLAGSAPLAAQSDSSDTWLDPGQTIAVLSPRNLTNVTVAKDSTVKFIEEYLSEKGLAYVPSEKLRPTLRKYRIRSNGQISATDAGRILAQWHTGLFLISCIDFYRADDNPEFGVSLRLVNSEDMKVIAACSAASNGKEHVKLFGVGAINDINELAHRVIHDAIDCLFERAGEYEKDTEPKLMLAVIRFDNLSDFREGGAIVTNWTISELSRRRYAVLEPGAAMELATTAGEFPVGGIGMPQLEKITERFDIDYVITGQLDLLRYAQGISRYATPRCEFGARLLAARPGRVLASYQCEATGSDGHIVFGLGKLSSAGRLIGKKVHDMVSDFIKQDKRLAGIDNANKD